MGKVHKQVCVSAYVHTDFLASAARALQSPRTRDQQEKVQALSLFPPPSLSSVHLWLPQREAVASEKVGPSVLASGLSLDL